MKTRDIKCEDIMRSPVQSAGLEDSVAVAARKMRDSNIGFLAICDEDGQAQGVLTDRDIVLRVCAHDKPSSQTKVFTIMTDELVTCEANDDLSVVQQRMSKFKKSRILIVNDMGQPVGVVSLSDIAAHHDPRATETLRNVAQREVVEDKTPPSTPSHS